MCNTTSQLGNTTERKYSSYLVLFSKGIHSIHVSSIPLLVHVLYSPTNEWIESVSGKEYFKCMNKYGAFLRPNKVVVGDFPEEDLDDLLDDEF